MKKKIINPADISETNCSILYSHWIEAYNENKTPSYFFNSLPIEILSDFKDKLKLRCVQILKKGYKVWAYEQYRTDRNPESGPENLSSDVYEYLNKSSEKDGFVNLKEVFKHGQNQINKNLNRMIKQVLAGNRNLTVIDTLLSRIERIADDPKSKIVRNRTGTNGLKADFFTLYDKFPEEREPTKDEVEKAISLVGAFKETPTKKSAKQASRIYTTKQLNKMMEIICESLPTDVTPNTLTNIFIDLIPDFLPKEFLRDIAYKVEGEEKFLKSTLEIDVNKESFFDELDHIDQIIIKEVISESINLIEKRNLRQKFKLLNEHLNLSDSNAQFDLSELIKHNLFSNIDEINEIIDLIKSIKIDIDLALESDESRQIAFKLFCREV